MLAQQFPIAPNAYDAAGKRIGNWIIWYDSHWQETAIKDSVAFYRLMRFEEGIPAGKVRDFYRTGVKQWDGFLLSMNPDVQDGEVSYYHENGKVKNSYQVKANKKNGFYKSFTVNGELEQQGTMKNDSATGKWVSFYADGSKYIEVEYRNDQVNGSVLAYFPSGKIQSKGYKMADLTQGKWEEFYENGQTKSRRNFKDGLEDGASETFFENGQTESKGVYHHEKKTGRWIYYYDNGKISSEGVYDAQGLRTGQWKFYHQNGNIKMIAEQQDSKLNGAYKDYYESGKLKTQGVCQNDLWQGPLTGYFENGNIQKKGNYAADSLDGDWLYYFENGQLNSQGKYSDNKKEGAWKYYDTLGRLETEENFVLGKLNGQVINYFSNGNISEKKNYTSGKENGLYESYYENGQLKITGKINHGEREGERISYYSNGQIDSKNNYRNGQWQDYYVSYYANGKKKNEGLAAHGKMEGFRKFYFAHGQLKGEGNMHEDQRHGHWVFYDSASGKKESEGEYVDGKTNGKWNFYLEPIPYAYYIYGFEETFYNIRDSLHFLLRRGAVEPAAKTLAWMERVRQRDQKNNKLEKILMLYWKGYLADVEQKYNQSLNYYDQYLKKIKALKGDTCVEYQNGINNKALVLDEVGRTDEALQMLQSLASLSEKKVREFPADINAYENAASLLNNHGRYTEEETYLQRVLAHRKNNGKTFYRNTARLLTLLGSLYLNDLSDYTKSKKIFNQIIRQGDSLHFQDDAYYGNAYYQLGNIHWLEHQPGLALTYLRKAKALQQNQLQEAPVYFLSTLNRLGKLYQNQNHIDSAYQVFNQMQDAITRLGWQQTVWQPVCYHGLAQVFFARYEKQKGIDYWLKAKEAYEQQGLTNRVEYAEVLQGLSVSLPSADVTQTARAEKYLLQAIDIVHKAGGQQQKYRAYLMSLARFYNDNDQFAKAANTLNIVRDLILQAEGEGAEYGKCLNLMGENEADQGRYASAIDLYRKALKLFTPIKKDFPTEYVETYNYLGSAYNSLNQMQEAEAAIREALAAARDLFGEQSMVAIEQLQDLAIILKDRNLFSDSEKYYKESGALIKKMLGDKNIKYAYSINSLANMYRQSNNYKKALEEYTQYKNLLLSFVTEQSLEYALLLTNLGFTYEGLGNPTEAEKLHLQSAKIIAKIIGTQNVEYGWKLKNLGDLYQATGNAVEAEKKYEEVKNIFRLVYGESDSRYANSLKNLAQIKIALDKPKEAEQLLVKAVEINQKNKDDHFGSYFRSVENLQEFYMSFGRYADAITQLNTIIPLMATKWGKGLDYANNLIRKGIAFGAQNNYDSASYYLLAGLPILEEHLPPNHANVLAARNQLGTIALRQFKYAEAEKQYRYCAEQYKIAGNENTSVYASSLNNLALALAEQHDYGQAEKLLSQSLAIDSRLKDHIGIDFSRLNLAKIYLANRQWAAAETNFRQALESRLNYLLSNFYFLSDHEKAQYWRANRFFVDYFQSFAVQRASTNPAILQEFYNLQLNTKGILLSTSNKIKKRILSSGDSAMVNMYFRWHALREQLAQLYSLSPTELKNKKARQDSLENQAQVTEKELNISADDLEKDKGKKATWRDVQKILSADEAAIEIVRVKHHTTHPTDSVLYAALILTAETKTDPLLAIIPNGNLLEGRALKYYKNAITNQLDDRLSYKNYWAPIQSFIENKKRIYLSLDGVYHSINLNTLHHADGKFLVDEKNITLLANTRDLLFLKNKKKTAFTKANAVLLGYPKYFLGKDKVIKKIDSQRDVDVARLSDEDRSGIAELPGTKDEIQKINSILQTQQWKIDELIDEQATETSVKEAAQPRLMHIATHGFFSDATATGTDPMLRAGLLFTGAANYFQDKINVGTDDGVLTAYEASNLNLDNTEMVVLSACETGQGEVQNGEGVYGLQRAFQTAGAKSILMSLWKVDDTATQDLMTTFYQNWMAGKSKAEAFRQAQLTIKNKYGNPYYWGAFVLMGE